MESVFRAALAMCRQWDLAEDLTQATFTKAFERFGTFRRGSNCKAWLVRILRNAWIDRLRHRKVVGPSVPIEEELVEDTSAPDRGQPWEELGEMLESFSDEQVIRALQELPEEQRWTLYLVDVEELSQEEVAEITDVAVGTVKSRTSRARAMLRDRLREHARDLGFPGRRT